MAEWLPANSCAIVHERLVVLVVPTQPPRSLYCHATGLQVALPPVLEHMRRQDAELEERLMTAIQVQTGRTGGRAGGCCLSPAGRRWCRGAGRAVAWSRLCFRRETCSLGLDFEGRIQPSRASRCVKVTGEIRTPTHPP
jgi:hypothetical protein